mgnify:CR=1 FL=1
MGNEDNKEINAVAVKLPTFWPSNPRAWFVQAEAQFTLRQITSEETKYAYVVASLDQQTAARCIAFLERAQSADKYKTFKKHLIQTFELSEDERADQLLNLRHLGDRRPSELADVILQLNGNQPMHFVLRRIFLRALPSTVRNAIATSPLEDLRDLAREADRALAAMSQADANLNTLEDVPGASSYEHEADAVNVRRPRQLCVYHRKFNVRARRCVQPCDWVPNLPRKTQGNDMGGPR